MMRAGKMFHRLQWQRDVATTQQANGELQPSWQTKGILWGSFEPLRGRELQLATQINAEINSMVSIRYRSGMRPHDRLAETGRVLDIQAVINPDEKNESMKLLCIETVAT